MASSLYRGIALPFDKGPTALPKAATDSDLINQSLRQIILTGRRERVMRPEFGCDAFRFVHENNNELLSELIRTEVSTAVGRFEPRVALQDILVERSEDLTTVYVTIIYVIVATRTQDSVKIKLPEK